MAIAKLRATLCPPVKKKIEFIVESDYDGIQLHEDRLTPDILTF
jgi:hypothetical protein